MSWNLVCLAALRSGADTAGPTPVERNLLSRFKGDSKPQSKSARPAPSLALGLCVGSEEERRNRPVNAAIRRHADSSEPLVPSLGRGSSVPVQAAAAAPLRPQIYAPSSSSAGQVGLQHAAWVFYGHLYAAATTEVYELRTANEDLCREVSRLRGMVTFQRGMVRQLQEQAGAGLRCPACRARPATVVLVPREHLCLCFHCWDASRVGLSVACPLCAIGRAWAR